MNTRHKFRAWNKLTETMDNFDNSKSGILYRCGEFNVSSGWDSYKQPTFDNETSIDFELMQWTGLQDKNGNPIFEGDIISLTYNNKSAGEVFWRTEDVSFYQRDKNGHIFGFCSANTDYEIIGNIYENPELMESDND